MLRNAFGDHAVLSALFGVTALGYDDHLVETEGVAAALGSLCPPGSALRHESMRDERSNAPSAAPSGKSGCGRPIQEPYHSGRLVT